MMADLRSLSACCLLTLSVCGMGCQIPLTRHLNQNRFRSDSAAAPDPNGNPRQTARSDAQADPAASRSHTQEAAAPRENQSAALPTGQHSLTAGNTSESRPDSLSHSVGPRSQRAATSQQSDPPAAPERAVSLTGRLEAPPPSLSQTIEVMGQHPHAAHDRVDVAAAPHPLNPLPPPGELDLQRANHSAGFPAADHPVSGAFATSPARSADRDDPSSLSGGEAASDTASMNDSEPRLWPFAPRIPDVWPVGRRTPSSEDSSTDWSLGIGTRLLPSPRSSERESPPEAIRTAGLSGEAAQPVEAWPASSVYGREELGKLIALLETELAHARPTTEAQRRSNIRGQVLLRTLYLLADRPHDAQRAIAGIDPADQEFWSQLHWAMASYFDEEMLPSRADRAAQTVGRLASAQHALQPLVPLEIHQLEFCRRIHSFGNYEAFGINEFEPGQPLLLYVEVRHFASETDEQGWSHTALGSTIELYSESGERTLIDRIVFPDTEDVCRGRRTDYFHSYRLDLPVTLRPGPHLLQMTMEDRLTGKTATVSRRFIVRPAANVSPTRFDGGPSPGSSGGLQPITFGFETD